MGLVKDVIWGVCSVKADLGPRGRQFHSRTTTIDSSRRGGKGTPVWGKQLPSLACVLMELHSLPRAPTPDLLFFFSCGLHTVLLQSGLLPLCRPSPFWRRRHAWFHTWKIYVIGQRGLCNTFTIPNRIGSSQFPPSRPLRFLGKHICTYSKKHEIKNSTKHRLTFPLQVLYLAWTWGAPVDLAGSTLSVRLRRLRLWLSEKFSGFWRGVKFIPVML